MCVAGTLTKLLLRLRKLQGHTPHKMVAEAMLFVAAILRLGESHQISHPINSDSLDRMVTCLQVRSHARTHFDDHVQSSSRLSCICREDPLTGFILPGCCKLPVCFSSAGALLDCCHCCASGRCAGIRTRIVLE